MSIRMQVQEVFRINQKTIFSGNLETDMSHIKDIKCNLVINNSIFEVFEINGEVHAGRFNSDLWTRKAIDLKGACPKKDKIIIECCME